MRSMKTARVWIKDGAFALSFFCPHRGTFGSSSVPSPGNLPSTAKKMLIPGSHPSGGREGWAQLDLTDACDGELVRTLLRFSLL